MARSAERKAVRRSADRLAAFYQTNETRQRLSELGLAVNEQRTEFSIGTRQHHPTHLMCGASTVDAETLRSCIHVGADEARKNWSTIRAIVRSLGLRFAICLGGEPIAVLKRHPDFDVRATERYLEIATQKTLLESQPAIIARLDRLESMLMQCLSTMRVGPQKK